MAYPEPKNIVRSNNMLFFELDGMEADAEIWSGKVWQPSVNEPFVELAPAAVSYITQVLQAWVDEDDKTADCKP